MSLDLKESDVLGKPHFKCLCILIFKYPLTPPAPNPLSHCYGIKGLGNSQKEGAFVYPAVFEEQAPVYFYLVVFV